MESFTPKASESSKRVLEVFEAVETAVTQLTNLDALRYIKEDFGLMAKIVNKLPLDDQKRYDEYITSEEVLNDPSPEWDKLWKWLEKLHKLAVQGNLRNMCSRADSSSHAPLKSNVTCNTCGGLGHYARACPSKSSKPGGGSFIKVNMAVTKITTKDEYKQYLPETRKQIGKCPLCNQPAHSYSRQFPFGKSDWPSSRLDVCPQFLSKSSKERGEFIEKIKGCYKCTS